jgi:hypothetical protein
MSNRWRHGYVFPPTNFIRQPNSGPSAATSVDLEPGFCVVWEPLVVRATVFRQQVEPEMKENRVFLSFLPANVRNLSIGRVNLKDNTNFFHFIRRDQWRLLGFRFGEESAMIG